MPNDNSGTGSFVKSGTNPIMPEELVSASIPKGVWNKNFGYRGDS